MLKSFKEFFTTFVAPAGDKPEVPAEHALQVAAAALLVEMMRVDRVVSETEQQAVLGLLERRFGLTAEETAALVDLAAREAQESTGDYAFTSLINKGFSAEQKVHLIEMMWQIAYIDGHLDAHENHLMRKIADLLHVGHGDYALAKQRGREKARVGGGAPAS